MGLRKTVRKLLGKKEEPPKLPPARPVVHLSLDKLVPNRHAKDVVFADEGIDDILERYRRTGKIDPVVVRPLPDGKHMIVNGEARWHAARHVGLRQIPCYVQGIRTQAEAPTEIVRKSDGHSRKH